MSSKLKAKPRKQRFPLAQPNQAAQAFGRAMVNCQSQIKDMEKEAYESGFNDSEDWADTINVVTTMMALRRLYGFSTKRLLTVMQTANEYVKMANEGEMSVLSMIQDIEENTDVRFDEMNKNLVKKMAETLVKANCPYLKVGERKAAPMIYTQRNGQVAFG